MVQIDLLVVVGFNVLSLTVCSHEVHIQQGGAAVEIKLSAGDFV